MAQADVLVIGGGIIGMSVAYHLLQRSPGLKVAVLEKAEAPGTGSTARATGGIRFQFASAVNIRLSLLSHPEWENFADRFGVEIGLVRHGYLFVTGQQETLAALEAQVALQQSLGVPTQLLTPAGVAAAVPAMRSDDLLGGSICPWDGSADPYLAMGGYWQRARALGAQVVTGCPVTAMLRAGDRITGVRTPQGDWLAGAVVNAAGPHAGQIGRLAGIAVPVEPYKRSVFVASPPPGWVGGIPLCVDLDTGWYVHEQRRDSLLLGGTDKVLHPGLDVTVTWPDQERVLAAAVRRLPCLADARIGRSYAGLREITPDFHAILGPAPELRGLYLACGFSGHGFMHAPAAGLLTAEFILDGDARSLDAAPLLLDRFTAGPGGEEAAVF